MNAVFNFVSEHSISLGTEKVKFIFNSLDKRIIFIATCAFVFLTAIYNRPRIAILLSSLYDSWYRKSLNLSHLELKSIPPEIWHFPNLLKLNLGYNQITSIPPGLGNLSKLLSLHLSHNEITSLPIEIGNLHALEMLDVSFNPKLTQLPQSLGQCPNLTHIHHEGTGIPHHEVQAVLAASKALRDNQAAPDLAKRLKAWKDFSKEDFELEFITDLTDHEKCVINEWLLRLQNTKDFSAATKKSLACAVCGILQSLNESSSFKTLFFDQIASNLRACGDQSAMAFNELFLSWKLETLDPFAPEHDKFQLMIQESKTAALRGTIQKCIAEQEAKEGQEINESVEIYLYYETELKKELGLLSFMDKMIYTDIGRRDWIDKKTLAKEVNCTFLEEMAELPSLVAIRDLDPKYTEQWSSFENEFNDQLDEVEQKLKDQSINDGIYNEEMKKIHKNREETQRKETIKWLKLKLKSHGLLF